MVSRAVTGKRYRRQMCSVYHALATAAPIMPRAIAARRIASKSGAAAAARRAFTHLPACVPPWVLSRS